MPKLSIGRWVIINSLENLQSSFLIFLLAGIIIQGAESRTRHEIIQICQRITFVIPLFIHKMIDLADNIIQISLIASQVIQPEKNLEGISMHISIVFPIGIPVIRISLH